MYWLVGLLVLEAFCLIVWGAGTAERRLTALGLATWLSALFLLVWLESREVTMPVIVYSFDVDETLEISNGPITLQSLMDLRVAGHIVGICGNWGLFVNRVPGWQHLASFLSACPPVFTAEHGEMNLSKAWILQELKQYIPADDYVHVGNIRGRTNSLGHICGSDDDIFAKMAGWRFILEDDFAKGVR